MESVPERSRYAVVVRVPRQIEVRIEDVYLGMLNTSKPTMGYHVTLLGPFYLDGDRLAACASAIADACQEGPALIVRLTGLGTFKSKDDNSVYVRVLEDGSLSGLHRRLAERTESLISLQYEWSRGHGWDAFQPHVTLALLLTDRELGAFLRSSEDSAMDESFVASEVCLAEERPTEPWRYVHAFALGGEQVEGSGETATCEPQR